MEGSLYFFSKAQEESIFILELPALLLYEVCAALAGLWLCLLLPCSEASSFQTDSSPCSRLSANLPSAGHSLVSLRQRC